MLKKMIAPIKEEEFFSEYWEKKPLYIQRNDPEYYSDIVSMDAVDEMISLRTGNWETFRLSESLTEECMINDQLSKRRLFELYEKGETLIMPQAQLQWDSLRKFITGVQHYFKCRHVHGNLYLTPANNQGFKPHYDTWNVFVAQIHGLKHWKLHHIPIKLPFEVHKLLGEQWTRGVKVSKPTKEIMLNPGDTLYLPRGLVHEAVAQDQASLHITVGVRLEFMWVSLLNNALDVLTKDRPEFSRSAPFMPQLGESSPKELILRNQEMESFIQKTLKELTDPSIISAAFDKYNCEWNSQREVFSRHQLDNIDKLDTLSPDTIVKPRPFFKYHYKEEETEATVSFLGQNMKFSLPQMKAFKYLTAKTNCSIKELPGLKANDEKIDFIRLLILNCAVSIKP